jgi:hypothetical protein
VDLTPLRHNCARKLFGIAGRDGESNGGEPCDKRVVGERRRMSSEIRSRSVTGISRHP